MPRQETALKQARRAARRRAVVIVGLTAAGLAAIALAFLWYLVPPDQESVAKRKVQAYFVRDGVRQAEVPGCFTSTDYERSLALFSCNVSSPLETLKTTPRAVRDGDSAYLCFIVDIDETGQSSSRWPPVRFFGVATARDREICVLADSNSALLQG
jgi:hypothetical protein